VNRATTRQASEIPVPVESGRAARAHVEVVAGQYRVYFGLDGGRVHSEPVGPPFTNPRDAGRFADLINGEPPVSPDVEVLPTASFEAAVAVHVDDVVRACHPDLRPDPPQRVAPGASSSARPGLRGVAHPAESVSRTRGADLSPLGQAEG
jgi:hypothetical protein